MTNKTMTPVRRYYHREFAILDNDKYNLSLIKSIIGSIMTSMIRLTQGVTNKAVNPVGGDVGNGELENFVQLWIMYHF